MKIEIPDDFFMQELKNVQEVMIHSMNSLLEMRKTEMKLLQQLEKTHTLVDVIYRHINAHVKKEAEKNKKDAPL